VVEIKIFLDYYSVVMKVVHVITKLELGGAQVNTIYTYENLDRERFEAWLICGPGGILTERVEKKENLVIVDELVRPIHPLKDFKAYRRLVEQFKKIKPDVVHTHSSKTGILGRLAAKKAGVPVIIHSVHGFSFSPFQSFLKRNLFVTAEKWVANKTTHFVFVSNDDIEIAKEKKLVNTNYSLIRSGFPFKKFQRTHDDPSALRKTYDLEPGDFVCGIIAPFKPQKGLFHLIEIAARVIEAQPERKMKFIITGDGALREAIETKLKEKGIFEHFRLPGFVFDIENAIDVFDLGVSTALWEGLPQSLVQLRLKKKAVVASDIPGNREVIEDNKNGYLVEVTDYHAFSQKILHLVENEKERQRLADFNQEDFSPWDAANMVKEQENLYTRLRARNPG
jgi:glycosyltransferase involved in cell wall biosynthesis